MQYVKPHYMLAIGNVWFIAQFWMLASLQTYHWSLALVALAWALNRTYYWTGFHYSFSSARAHKHGGVQIAGVNALVILMATSAPAVGGIVATLFGIKYIYLTAIAFLVIASVPMLSPNKGPAKVTLTMPWKEFLKMRRDAVANFFNGMIILAEQSIWPMLVFLLVSSYAGIGLLSSVIAVASIATTLYVGRKEEIRGEQHYIKRGLATYSLTSVGRALVQNSSQVFGLNLLGGVGRSLYVTPFMNRYYSNSDGGHRLGYITIMETAFSIGSVVYVAALLLLSAFLPVKTVLVIGLATVAILVAGVRLIR
ncbi:hypothetical protein HY857_01585 [Candidatus Saccharibacteria bacterium]|nr:hypothetical protein [Candidatus Saccharibacteria bacterium]